MAEMVRVPLERVDAGVLNSMLEDYASRDGTDYGVRELELGEKVASLHAQLRSGSLAIVYDLASEQWDLLPQEQLEQWQI
jgi:uncharacterized protein YheU (UPF0270 family)